MDPQDDEGIYAALPLVHWQLAKIGQGRVFENVATAASVKEAQGESALQAAIGFLRERDALLVIDNCEHLTDAVGVGKRLDLAIACPCVDAGRGTGRGKVRRWASFRKRLTTITPCSAAATSPAA